MDCRNCRLRLICSESRDRSPFRSEEAQPPREKWWETWAIAGFVISVPLLGGFIGFLIATVANLSDGSFHEPLVQTAPGLGGSPKTVIVVQKPVAQNDPIPVSGLPTPAPNPTPARQMPTQPAKIELASIKR